MNSNPSGRFVLLAAVLVTGCMFRTGEWRDDSPSPRDPSEPSGDQGSDDRGDEGEGQPGDENPRDDEGSDSSDGGGGRADDDPPANDDPPADDETPPEDPPERDDPPPSEPGDGSREALVERIIGFGENTTGGLGGRLCHVTSLGDSGSGTLRDCAESTETLWIVFDLPGDIVLSDRILVESNKTIDGRGQNITITNYGMLIRDQSNIVIHNISFARGGDPERDALAIHTDSHDVWVDHCSFATFTDGLLDITQRATDVTVSWCTFETHRKVMLIGASDGATDDEVIRVTLHHNYFHDARERHPRLRYGRVHAFNNYIARWENYGIRAALTGQIFVENNIFEAGDSDNGIESEGGYIRLEGNWLIGSPVLAETNRDRVFDPSLEYDYVAEEANAVLRDRLLAGAGWQDVPLPE